MTKGIFTNKQGDFKSSTNGMIMTAIILLSFIFFFALPVMKMTTSNMASNEYSYSTNAEIIADDTTIDYDVKWIDEHTAIIDGDTIYLQEIVEIIPPAKLYLAIQL